MCCVLKVVLASLLENFGLVSDISKLYALSISSESVFENIGTGFFSLEILQESEVSDA